MNTIAFGSTVFVTTLLLLGSPAHAAISGKLPTVSPEGSVVLKPTIKEYADLFFPILENLRTNYWSADGNWEDDSQNDALTFGPAVLLNWGRSSRDADLIEKGLTTVNYELGVAETLLQDLWEDRDLDDPYAEEHMIELAAGIPSLIDAWLFDPKPAYGLALDGFLGAGTALVWCMEVRDEVEECEKVVAPICDEIGCLSAIGAVANVAFRMAGATSGLTRGSALALGRYALAAAERLHWNKDGGYYVETASVNYCGNDGLLGYSEAIILMALARARQETGNSDYGTRFDTVLSSMQAMYDAEGGGYFECKDHPTQSKIKYLATNLSMINALLERYRTTNDAALLDKVRDIFDFIRADLFADDTYEWPSDDKEGNNTNNNPGYYMAYHDYTPGTRTRAHHHCTGCNFFLLANIYLFNQVANQS